MHGGRPCPRSAANGVADPNYGRVEVAAREWLFGFVHASILPRLATSWPLNRARTGDRRRRINRTAVARCGVSRLTGRVRHLARGRVATRTEDEDDVDTARRDLGPQ